jgi:single-strand DNA-binding protein
LVLENFYWLIAKNCYKLDLGNSLNVTLCRYTENKFFGGTDAMNLCILQAEIMQEPQLRYTPDNQLAVTDMLVQVPGLRPDDPQGRLKVVVWGGLAEQTVKQFKVGDQVLIEGRLGMVKVDLPNGSRTTRPELTASRIFPVHVGDALVAEDAPPRRTSVTEVPAPHSQTMTPTDESSGDSTPF